MASKRVKEGSIPKRRKIGIRSAVAPSDANLAKIRGIIAKGKDSSPSGVPDSFKILLNELRALGLNVELLKGPLRTPEVESPSLSRTAQSRTRLVAGKLAYLKERLGGVGHVAEAVHADKSRVSRWVKGAGPDEKNFRALSDLEFVLSRLSRIFDDATADKWLVSRNAFLHDQRPIDILNQGRVVDVLSAADQEEAGSYS